MCKTKRAVDASAPSPSRRTTDSLTRLPTDQSRSAGSSSATASSYYSSSSSVTASLNSRTSLSSLREERSHIYDFNEIRSATNNFLAKRHSSSSASCWRCTLRGRDTIVFQRKFRRKIELKQRLAVICRSHHGSIVRLLGASISGGGDDYIYMVYEFIKGANLADCLRNSRNPSYTVLSSWMSRIQIATDLAHGLDYIHNNTGIINIGSSLVHNRIKSSSIIVTEPSLNAKICHFGTAQLCGETEEEQQEQEQEEHQIRITEKRKAEANLEKLTRSESRSMQFEGVRGYMSPEFRSTGFGTQKSDVYAFGVLLLELISGQEPLKYKFERTSGNFVRTSIIDTAAEAVASSRNGGVRWWVDRRMQDSFPVDVAEKLIKLALNCVNVEPDKRPDMGRVAVKISRLYLESKTWSETVKMPDGFSVSTAPR